jgi:hypothetical protein
LEKSHFKDFQLRLENSEVRIHERIMNVDPKGTHVSGLSTLRKSKGRLKGWKVEISEPQIPEGIVTIDSIRPRIVRSWNQGEMIWEQAEFENQDSRSLKGEIDLFHWFGGPHVTWSLRRRITRGWRKEGRKGR